METRPKIDDKFWFDYSEQFVKGSITRLDDALRGNSFYMKGLLGVYTASSLLVIDIKEVSNFGVLFFLTVPYVIYLFGNWQVTNKSMPMTIEFDPRSPEEIEHAYMKAHISKEASLKKSIRISLFLTIYISIVLLSVYMFPDLKKEEPIGKDSNYSQTSSVDSLLKIDSHINEIQDVWVILNLSDSTQIHLLVDSIKTTNTLNAY